MLLATHGMNTQEARGRTSRAGTGLAFAALAVKTFGTLTSICAGFTEGHVLVYTPSTSYKILSNFFFAKRATSAAPPAQEGIAPARGVRHVSCSFRISGRGFAAEEEAPRPFWATLAKFA